MHEAIWKQVGEDVWLEGATTRYHNQLLPSLQLPRVLPILAAFSFIFSQFTNSFTFSSFPYLLTRGFTPPLPLFLNFYWSLVVRRYGRDLSVSGEPRVVKRRQIRYWNTFEYIAEALMFMFRFRTRIFEVPYPYPHASSNLTSKSILFFLSWVRGLTPAKSW